MINMKKILYLQLVISVFVIEACRSTKKIQTAISKKDTAQVVRVNDTKFDSAGFIQNVVTRLDQNHIDFNTFSAKIKVDYRGGDGKDYDFNTFLRMEKDSVI